MHPFSGRTGTSGIDRCNSTETGDVSVLEFKNLLFERVTLLDKWLEAHQWKAYDPFDGLSSTALSKLTFNNHFLRIALQQTIRRFPVNLRPLLGVSKQTSSKGMGFCALGYLKLHQATGSKSYLTKVRHCMEWLMHNYNPDYSGYAWGNHFSYESRGGSIPLGVPTVVWTSLIANAFLDAYEALGEEQYLRIAESAGTFIMNDIPRYTEGDSLCFMYTPLTRPDPGNCIHNSNVLCAWLLARLYSHTKEGNLLSLARPSINYTMKHQLAAGGWYYGEPSKYHWVDSFHTGYVLEAINGYVKASGDHSCLAKLRKGYHYLLETFFGPDGTPKYYDSRTYPLDIQCASQGIQTLAKLAEFNGRSLEVAKAVARWTIDKMQDPEGYFYFRKYPLITNKTPMFHWGQATMLSALAHLLAVL